MDETELAALVQRRVEDSLGTFGDQLSADRVQALKYYRGEPFGDEVDGRSKLVTHDVAEAVDSLMPPLLKVFLAGEKVVVFEPPEPEDEEAAEQATDYVNHVFIQQNDGFTTVYVTLKDGLLFKTGVAKVWWDSTPETSEERYAGLTIEQVDMMLADESIEVEVEQSEDGTFNAVVTRTNVDGRCRHMPVPPEEFLIDRYATKIDQSTPDGPLFTGHRQLRIVSDVVQEYPDKKDAIEAMAGIGGDADYSGERRERWALESPGQIPDQDENDMATRPVWVVEAYVRVDYDGDGIAELRKVTCAGETGYEVLDNVEVEDNPFAAWSPILMPHKFHGMSIFDQIKDLQLAKSTFLRGIANNLYQVNEPMTQVVDGEVDLDALLNRRVGGIVTTTKLDSMREIVVPYVGGQTMPMLEYMDTLREQRTGVTRYSQGLDAESLNKTARGISIIQDASQQRQELIARVYAEVFMKRLFSLMLRCVSKYQKASRMIRLRNKWVPMDPRAWKNRYDMTVTVGLGTGNRDQQAAHAMNILNVQKELILAGSSLASQENVYNTLTKLIESIGWKSIDPYFTSPAGQQPQAPPPDPKAIEAQGKAQAAQADIQAKAQLQAMKEQMDHQYRMKKLESDHDVAVHKADLESLIKGWSAEQDKDISLAKAIDELEVRKMVAEDDIGRQRESHVINLDMARHKAEMDEERKSEEKSQTIVVGAEGAMKKVTSTLDIIVDKVKEMDETITAPKTVDVQRVDGKIVGAKVTQNGKTSEIRLN